MSQLHYHGNQRRKGLFTPVSDLFGCRAVHCQLRETQTDSLLLANSTRMGS
jgi:hypothetical protein